MLAVMSADEEKCAANGGVLPEHFQRIIEIGILDGENRAAEMGEGIFEGLNGFGFVCGAGVDGFGVDAGGRGSAEGASDAVIGGGDVGVRLRRWSGTPSAGRQEYFSAGMASARRVGSAARRRRVRRGISPRAPVTAGSSGGGGGLVLGWGWMREKHDGAKCEQNCRRKRRMVPPKFGARKSEKDFTTELELARR